MNNNIFALAGVCLLLVAACSALAPEHKHTPEPKPTIRLSLIPQMPLVVGKPVTVLAKLNTIDQRTILTNDDLETVHTSPFHLLVIDPTLTDYQHIHPQPAKTPGVYSFTFTPKSAEGYRAWADITLKTTHQQTFVMTDLGAHKPGAIAKVETHEANIGGYHFTLSFDKPPVLDGESMGTISVTDSKGKAVTNLEPVMGSNAHVVGFYDDFRTVVHTHAMNETPNAPITFHLMPSRSGFLKLFAQVKIGGKELFVPFGVMVGNAAP